MRRIERNPKTGRAIKGAVSLWHLDTTYYKDKITRMIHSDPVNPKWNIHAVPMEDYLLQICSEHKTIERNRQTGATKVEWKLRPGANKNHLWDCEVYAAAAADMMRVSALRRGMMRQEPRKPSIRGSWLNRGGNWWENG